MKHDPMNRRMFLRGAGGVAVMLPFLSSLLPREARAAVTPRVRYVQVISPYGPAGDQFFAAHKAEQVIQPDVRVKSLATIAGDISPMVGAGFNNLKGKISLLRGLDVLHQTPNHGYLLPTTAASYRGGLDGDEFPPTTGQESIDVIISKSAKVYDGSTPTARRLLTLTPGDADDYSRNRTFSWRAASPGAAPQMVRPTKQTQALFDTFANGFAATPGAAPDPREQALIQSVYGDYKKLRDGARISAADKQRLESYMTLVDDISKGLAAPALSCSVPQRDVEANLEATITNQLRILAAAMACDLTRVASITLGMTAGYGGRHDQHHQTLASRPPAIRADFQAIGARVARLVQILDGIKEGSGTLLDNSVVYWNSQYGCVVPGGEHNTEDFPVLLAGSAGGSLRQGNLIDYNKDGIPVGNGGPNRVRRGTPINNLLVTLFNALGLGSSDYETAAGQGYGYYDNTFASRPNPAFWQSTAGKRSPLPHLYLGPARG